MSEPKTIDRIDAAQSKPTTIERRSRAKGDVAEPLEEELDQEANARAAEEVAETVEDEDAAVVADAKAGRIPQP
jgi:hypothetical protein